MTKARTNIEANEENEQKKVVESNWANLSSWDHKTNIKKETKMR